MHLGWMGVMMMNAEQERHGPPWAPDISLAVVCLIIGLVFMLLWAIVPA